MWPMLAGLSPLLPEGELGRFVGPRTDEGIFHRRGTVGTRIAGGEQTIRSIADFRVPAQLKDAPVAVLIDSGVLSSGEIVAALLRSRPRTRLIGSPTFGIATGNRSFRLPDGAVIMLTVADIADAEGRTYRDGVMPDVQVPNTGTEPEADAPLEAARSWLRTQGCH